MDYEHATELLQHTHWANHRVAHCLAQHPEALLADPTILALMGHVLSAEHLWCERIGGNPGPFDAWQLFTPADLPAAIDASSTNWTAMLKSHETERLRHIMINYHRPTGEPFVFSLAHIIAHVAHHGTHHRAQVLTRLKLQGVQQLPVLDFIAWARQQ